MRIKKDLHKIKPTSQKHHKSNKTIGFKAEKKV
jgi:hypothetical protein